MRKLGLFIIFVGAIINGRAQDVHLSQFYTAQQNLNPALSGNYDGDFRVAGNYRSQWREISDPITTSVIAFDKKIPIYSDELDLGLIVINDQFVGFNLNTNQILITASYAKDIDYHELRGGIQFGLVMKSTDLKDQTFPNQWTYETGEFDVGIDNMETNITEAQNYIDLNMGFSWSKRYGKIKPTVGIAMFHLDRPADTYFDTPIERLNVMQTYHASAVIDVKDNISIEPKLLYMRTTAAQNALIGSNFKYHIKDSKLENVYAGVLYRDGFGRNNDAIIPIVGFKFDMWDIGVSYDVNISNLSQYTARKSTLEISLIYTSPLFNPKNLAIPCDRY